MNFRRVTGFRPRIYRHMDGSLGYIPYTRLNYRYYIVFIVLIMVSTFLLTKSYRHFKDFSTPFPEGPRPTDHEFRPLAFNLIISTGCSSASCTAKLQRIECLIGAEFSFVQLMALIGAWLSCSRQWRHRKAQQCYYICTDAPCVL